MRATSTSQPGSKASQSGHNAYYCPFVQIIQQCQRKILAKFSIYHKSHSRKVRVLLIAKWRCDVFAFNSPQAYLDTICLIVLKFKELIIPIGTFKFNHYHHSNIYFIFFIFFPWCEIMLDFNRHQRRHFCVKKKVSCCFKRITRKKKLI